MTDTDSIVANRLAMSRYDLVLAVIPAALIWSALLASVLGIGLETGLLFGAVVGGAALLDAVVFNPPQEPRTGGNSI